MEIDLNHSVAEVKKNSFCYGDSDKGSHLEQAVSSSPFPPMDLPTYDLQPQILCRVANVQLLANKENDEVYTQLTLLPLPELGSGNLEHREPEDLGLEEEGAGLLLKSTPHMFCKTLTASDTSTHGGFSVPRRAAEDCFPPLDYKQQRPSQELVAKDLHGVEWRFRHIYRGQPRRHLLTTGWSIFVSQKNLLSGDAVLFLKGEDRELQVGIRRAVRPRNDVLDSAVGNKTSYKNVLSLVANAISNKSMFHVFYSPRASHAEFIVPYQRYKKSIDNPISIGTRFKKIFKMDDSPERCSGVVTGFCDLDTYKWPNSKWRCLMVRWDEDIVKDHQECISPWEIDPSVSLPPVSTQSDPKLKKLRIGLLASSPNHPIDAGGGGCLDFEGSMRSSKVLQGQENTGFASLPCGCDKVNCPLDFESQPLGLPSLASTMIEDTNTSEFLKFQPRTYRGILESNRYPKVLQGQEICPLRSLMGKVNFKPWASVKPSLGCNYVNLYDGPQPSFYPLASEGVRNIYFPFHNIYKNDITKENILSNFPSFDSRVIMHEVRKPSSSEQKAAEIISLPPSLNSNMNNQKDLSASGHATDCKLFGFPLTEEIAAIPNSGKRSCTKVHKQGSLVGRAIDLSKLNGYTELLRELERLFGMEGLLRDPAKGWKILYTDSENDLMLVGDDPWHEFCNVVSKIQICTNEEVKNMTVGILIDDNQSCLEEAPVLMDASKSSSVGRTDSSPTTVQF
ncbi:hypothetical protein Nepgr_012783 [Nepenthes gracilis]|uniref:Auxin response factor n=1 Tax=Nepenthes gracilis TaxID=150966 RepID=A0AAD3SGQ5_NEPGR|nr:hypothetical protein Nepgr_012783 [Nepenthes gracilis]